MLEVRILGCGSSGGVPRLGEGGPNWGACDPENPKNRRLRCSILVTRRGTDGETRVLAETAFAWTRDQTYTLTLRAASARLVAAVNGQPLLDVIDEDQPLDSGGVALLCTEGTVVVRAVAVEN